MNTPTSPFPGAYTWPRPDRATRRAVRRQTRAARRDARRGGRRRLWVALTSADTIPSLAAWMGLPVRGAVAVLFALAVVTGALGGLATGVLLAVS